VRSRPAAGPDTDRLRATNGSGETELPPGRPQAHGKFLSVGGEKLWVKGVTYGTFRPDDAGAEFHASEQVASDFAAMASVGINAVRTYTPPPEWLLDCAAEHGLRVLVGLPWEQHVTFLDDRARAAAIVERVQRAVARCAGHPAVLAYAVGNEIPAPIVRWHGRAKVERFIERLYSAAKDADPEALVTYVNYPSTEYLELPFLDIYAVNVYLEDRNRLEAYLARLHNLVGDRPLLLAEVGLDSRRNGEERQAAVLDWQIRALFEAGCAGGFVFSWTDEWHRGGHEIEDWDFGLTDRLRKPKPALAAVSKAFAEVPFADARDWPSFSVVVCSHNGSRTMRDTCNGLLEVDYPDVEVIVVDDGSTDGTGEIAREYGFRVITTENQGLSAARNTGWQAARGEIVAFLDDDARPDLQWLRYLAHTFMTTQHAAVGGPNVPPPEASGVEACVAAAPGGPIHVLVSDTEAEHIPGCNLAVRRAVLAELGGFDPCFRVAGDDVDICWRMIEAGWTIGYSPGALVWHRRRTTVLGYLRQQRGYGRAEALLERKWPAHYNVGGHRTWKGTIYGASSPLTLGRRLWRVYYGGWGTAPFQRLYQPSPTVVGSLLLIPEWWLLLAVLGLVGFLGLSWSPLLVVVPLLVLALGATVTEAGLRLGRSWNGPRFGLRLRLLTTSLYVLQPLARLVGRLGYGLTPWRQPGRAGFVAPWPRDLDVWSEEWQSCEDRLEAILAASQANGFVPIKGGDYDRWDLECRGGMLGGARLRHAIEEHGAGRQLVRYRVWPRVSLFGLGLPFLLGLLAALAFGDGAWPAAAPLGVSAVAGALHALRECGCAYGAMVGAVEMDPAQGLEQVLLTKVRETRIPESTPAGVQP
jgi:glycosyltransferase involved in cell wall biosynthesis